MRGGGVAAAVSIMQNMHGRVCGRRVGREEESWRERKEVGEEGRERGRQLEEGGR